MQQASHDLKTLADAADGLVASFHRMVIASEKLPDGEIALPPLFQASLGVVTGALKGVSTRVDHIPDQMQSHALHAAACQCIEVSEELTGLGVGATSFGNQLMALTEAIDYLKFTVDLKLRAIEESAAAASH